MMLLSAFVFVSLASAAPSPTPSPAPSVRAPQANIVSIPASWHLDTAHLRSRSKYLSRLGYWTSDDGKQSISLDVTPSFGRGLRGITQSISDGMSEMDHAMALSEAGTVRLCHSQDGWKQVYVGRAGNGITYVFGATASRAYIVTYTHKGSSFPLDGSAAAESLCPPPDPIVHLPPPPVDAPAGWNSVENVENSPLPADVTYWAWITVGHAEPHRFIAMRFPLRGHSGLSYGFTAMMARLANGHATVLDRTPVELCHDTDAVYVAMRYLAPIGQVFAESVMTIAGKEGYAAVYIRPASDRARPEAEHALRSLCPLKGQ